MLRGCQGIARAGVESAGAAVTLADLDGLLCAVLREPQDWCPLCCRESFSLIAWIGGEPKGETGESYSCSDPSHGLIFWPTEQPINWVQT